MNVEDKKIKEIIEKMLTHDDIVVRNMAPTVRTMYTKIAFLRSFKHEQAIADKKNKKRNQDQLKRLNDMAETLWRIQKWIEAYPLENFPPPDLNAAGKLLRQNGMTLDSISAHAMRHVLNGIKDIIEEGLKNV